MFMNDVTIIAAAQIASSGASSSPISINLGELIQYGILGIILLAIMFGYLWPKPSVDHMVEDYAATRDRVIADKRLAEDRAEKAEAFVRDTALPALAEATEAIRLMQGTLDAALKALYQGDQRPRR